MICCELEEKFVDLARRNFDLHRPVWEGMGCPEPFIVKGDSRKMREVFDGAGLRDAVVTSPPYAGDSGKSDRTKHERHERRAAETGLTQGLGCFRSSEAYGDTLGQLGLMETGTVEAVIASPPYAEIASGAGGLNTRPSVAGGQQTGRSASSPSQATDQRYGASPGQLARLPKDEVDCVLSSPPYSADGLGHSKATHASNDAGRVDVAANSAKFSRSDLAGRDYGDSAGQLSNLPNGEVDVVISSPPFGSGDSASAQSMVGRTDKSAQWVKANAGSAATAGYGDSAGQLGVMKAGDVDAVVTSPPYENSVNAKSHGIDWTKAGPATGNRQRGDDCPHGQTLRDQLAYGDVTAGNVGAESGETFWTAARDIVGECYAVLKPGGVAVWVVKAFVRNKQVVDFPGDWRKLCEHMGFITEVEVHASLVAEEHKTDLWGNATVVKRERKSFFRRLAEKKGSPKIDWEVVLFMRKPPMRDVPLERAAPPPDVAAAASLFETEVQS